MACKSDRLTPFMVKVLPFKSKSPPHIMLIAVPSLGVPVKFTTTFAANTTGLASATNKYSDAAFSMLILTVAPMLPIVL